MPFLCAMKDGRGRGGGKQPGEGRTFPVKDGLTGQSSPWREAILKSPTGGWSQNRHISRPACFLLNLAFLPALFCLSTV